jgi:hypothetical protein
LLTVPLVFILLLISSPADAAIRSIRVDRGTILRFGIEPGSAAEAVCEVTVTATFERRIKATEGTRAGTATVSIAEGGCSAGLARILTATQPWTISYISSSETLPAAPEITFEIREFSVLAEFARLISCLYGGNLRAIAVGRQVSTLQVASSTLPLLRTLANGEFCDETLRLKGQLKLSEEVALTQI